MKALKVVGVIVGILVALLLVVPLFLPSTTVVEKIVVVERPLEIIFDDLTNFNVYKQWSPWLEMEPDAETTITGEPGTVGHEWTWNGDIIGKGKLTIVEINTYESITNKLEFYEPRKAEAKDIWLLERTEEGNTKITWQFKSDASYPFSRLSGILIKSSLSDSYEQGLENLKLYIENKY